MTSTPLPRTPEQIVAYLNDSSRPGFGFLDFGAEVLACALTYDQAKAANIASPEATRFQWEGEDGSLIHTTVETATAAARDYLTFAFGKASDHRGISANCSVDKMGAYLWLLGSPRLGDFLTAGYTNYGAPQLKVAAEALNVPWPDDPELERMSQGRPCRDGCDSGCGL